MSGHRRARGFTLVEMATVVGVAAVLSALAWGAFDSLQFTARLRAAPAGLEAVINRARAESFARGAPVVVLLRSVDGEVHWESFVDPQADFDPQTKAAREETDVALEEGRLPSRVTLAAAPTTAPTPGPPLNRVPMAEACTFCDGAEGTGVIVFQTDGRVRLGVDAASRTVGGSFTLRIDSQAGVTYETVLVLSGSGLVRRVER